MSFEPKYKVNLDPPKDDAISQEYLAKCDGERACPYTPKCRAKLMLVIRHEPRLPNIRCDKGLSGRFQSRLLTLTPVTGYGL